MKGKVAVYFAAPNLGRLRSRINNAPKTLTSDLRNKLQEILVSVANDANLKIRAQFIEYIESREDLNFKTADHKKQATNLCSGIFDTVFAIDNAALDVLVGKDDDDEDPDEEAPAVGEVPPAEKAQEEAPAVGEVPPAEKAQEEATVDKKPAGKKGKAAADAGDEFED